MKNKRPAAPPQKQPAAGVEPLEVGLRRGMQLQTAHDWQAAEALYQQLLTRFPEDNRLLTLLASLYLQTQRHEPCIEFCMRLLSANPEQADVWAMIGEACYALGRYEEALTALESVLQLRETDAASAFLAGNACMMLGHAESAQAYYQRALQYRPDYAEAYHNLGIILNQRRQWQDALSFFNKAIDLKPDYLEAYTSCGNALIELGKHDFAIAHFDHVLQVQAQNPLALNGRGVALKHLRQHALALASFDAALAARPGFAEATLNRANALLALDRHEEALEAYGAALALTPHNPQVYSNRGNAYLDLGQYDAALQDYDQALQLEPDNATVLWNKALICLVHGDFEQGWHLFEHGWEAEGPPRGYRRVCSQPLWLGDAPIAGKRLLLTAEQGLGDTVQFVRYARLAANAGAQVILEAQPALVDLLKTMGPEFTVVERGTGFEAYDLYCPYMSLPLAFETTLATIPAHIPYLGVPETAHRFEFPALADQPQGLKVGLVWSGSATHMRDAKRSILLQSLAPLMTLPVEFHCLQKELRPADEAVMASLPIQDHRAALHQFADTAALIDAMDVVITVDTSVAHVAGAMGKPVWVLLPFVPDYRWLLTREDSPWYPTARLFRQAQRGDWSAVVARVGQGLQALLDAR
ncbi:tetratricopeptide repeat protein [Methylovorus sp. MP688]|uniref:tetratricopeptide repeat protein n=1 Tax=Methylovorus sp. (strain MP688) TaxID=887061 RepID=UPI0001EC439D|nr:tetratricopeptide repeat protein [Methylovorus sp. MP688]ADQ83337.1 TPR repeat-containing protein [Methylovorus sp. MP688]